MTCKACINGVCTYQEMCIDNVNLIIKNKEVDGTLHVENPKTGISGIVYPNLLSNQEFEV